VERIEIDPSGKLADIDRSNNVYPAKESDKPRKEGDPE
jgi:hypothetical protein